MHGYVYKGMGKSRRITLWRWSLNALPIHDLRSGNYPCIAKAIEWLEFTIEQVVLAEDRRKMWLIDFFVPLCQKNHSTEASYTAREGVLWVCIAFGEIVRITSDSATRFASINQTSQFSSPSCIPGTLHNPWLKYIIGIKIPKYIIN